MRSRGRRIYGLDPAAVGRAASTNATRVLRAAAHNDVRHGDAGKADTMVNCTDSRGRPKRRYATQYEAQNAADHGRATRGADLRVYECPECGGWHLTSRPERQFGGYEVIGHFTSRRW